MSAIVSTIPTWPLGLMPAAISDPVLVKPIMEGPQPLSGTAQTVLSDTGFWKITLSDLRVHGPSVHGATDRIALWRSLYNGTLANGLPVYMRLFDWKRGTRARAGLPLFGTSSGLPYIPLPADQTYTVGTGDATINANAAYRATSLSIHLASNVVPAAGDFFSLNDRLHQIVAPPVSAGSGVWTWTIVPGLRYAATSGDVIELADPICKMVLNPGDRSKSVQLDLGLVGRQSLTFVEANWT